MKGISTNVIEIILLIVGLAIVILFLIYFGSISSTKTTSTLSLIDTLRNVR